MYIKRIPTRDSQAEQSRVMELHNLHHQSKTAFQHASGSQDTCTSHQGTRASVTPEEWAKLRKENDTLDRMVHKLAYQVEELKESHKAVKAKADRYKQQLQLHVEAQEGFAAKHDKVKAQVKALTAERDRLQAKAETSSKRSTEGLVDCKAKLAATTSELKELKAQIPEVQKLLAKGGEAHRKVQALEEKQGKQVQELQKQLAKLKSEDKSSEGLRTKNQQLQSELVSTRERLKAAAGQASTSISQVQACKDMLSKADEVLRTCSDLHASKGDALASALQHTTNNLEAFLKTL
jgi:chromosome segregation ATPase